jgi:hypothetical protein
VRPSFIDMKIVHAKSKRLPHGEVAEGSRASHSKDGVVLVTRTYVMFAGRTEGSVHSRSENMAEVCSSACCEYRVILENVS